MGEEIKGIKNELATRLFGTHGGNPVIYPFLPPRDTNEPDPAYTPRQDSRIAGSLNAMGSKIWEILEDPRNAWIGMGPFMGMAKMPRAFKYIPENVSKYIPEMFKKVPERLWTPSSSKLPGNHLIDIGDNKSILVRLSSETNPDMAHLAYDVGKGEKLTAGRINEMVTRDLEFEPGTSHEWTIKDVFTDQDGQTIIKTVNPDGEIQYITVSSGSR